MLKTRFVSVQESSTEIPGIPSQIIKTRQSQEPDV
jgi:hypothetical protein